MQFSSVSDIKKYFDETNLLDNYEQLSEDEKYEKRKVFCEIYQKIAEFILHEESVELGDEALDAFRDYLANSNISDSSQTEIYELASNTIADLLPELLDKMSNRLHNVHNKIDDTLLSLVDSAFFGQNQVSEENLNKYNSIYDMLINVDPEYLSNYQGDNLNYLQLALDKEYIGIGDIIEYANKLPFNKKASVYRLLLKNNYDYIIQSRFLNNFFGEFGLSIKSQSGDKQVFKDFLINRDIYNETAIKYINYCAKTNYNLCVNSAYYELTQMDTFPLTARDVNYLSEKTTMAFYDYENLFGRLISDDITQLRYYHGRILTPNIINILLNKQSIIDDATLNEINRLFMENKDISFISVKYLYDTVYKLLINRNHSSINYYQHDNFDIYKYAINIGANVNKRDLVKFLLKYRELEEEDLIVLYNQFGIKPIKQEIIRNYKGDAFNLLISFPKVEYLLELLNINREIFVELALVNDYNWLDDMINIFDNNKISELIEFKKIMFNNVYHINHDTTAAILIKYMMEVIKNYQKYPDLCKDIVNNKYSDDDYERLKVLFDNPDIINENMIITSKEDLLTVENSVLEGYKSKFNEALNSDDINEVKNIICKILFAMDLNMVNYKLLVYGDITQLRQLLFDNRNNPEILDDIHEMLLYASMMEDIYECYDINALKDIIGRILNNQETYDLCKKCNRLFRSYDEKMNALYGKEASVNITSFSSAKDDLVDKEMTNKYGVKVIDFSDRKYCLLAHTIYIRKLDSLFNEGVYGKKMLISLSPISNRSQVLFNYDENKIAFLCDSFDPRLFIKSARTDLHSNSSLEEYSYNIDTSKFHNTEDNDQLLRQYGILDTCIGTEAWAPELLSYRSGIKFSAIALPGGREPTEKELEVAKKYNLIFVKTQELRKTIKNAKDIEPNKIDTRNHQIMSDNPKYDELKKVRKEFFPRVKNKGKKIGIITDSHGLFEPTLSALESMRKEGVDEVYSLGDNVGLGPNPKEVMDLLDAYGVKSVKGNHEEYLIDGVDKFKKHFGSDYKYGLAKANAEMTFHKLTPEQIEKIKAMPNEIVLDIDGHKILLTHWNKDYITKKEKEIPDDIIKTFQGHYHFNESSGKTETLRAVGFGQARNPKASYSIVEQSPEEELNIRDYITNYAIDNMMYDLEENGLDNEDKEKLESWTGGRSRR